MWHESCLFISKIIKISYRTDIKIGSKRSDKCLIKAKLPRREVMKHFCFNRKSICKKSAVLLFSGLLSFFLLSTTSLASSELEQLKQTIELLKDRLESLEAKQDAQDSKVTELETKDEKRVSVEKGDFPNSVKVGDVSLGWGGYTKADFIWNSAAAAGASNFRNELYIPSTVPLEGSTEDENDEFVAHAKETRLWFKGTGNTPLGPWKVVFETDLFNLQSTDSERITNGNTPRVRHAFGQLGNFTAGQTWSTFMPVFTFPETNDFGGPAGQIFVRQMLGKYTKPTSFGSFSLALENPESTFETDAALGAGRVVPSDDQFPDVIGRLDFKGDWGVAAVAAMARNFAVDATVGGVSIDDDEWGGAVMAGIKLNTGGKNHIKAAANYGATGRYNSYNAFAGAHIDSTGDIDTIDVLGANIGYTHYWSPNWYTTALVGYANADNDSDIRGAANETIWNSTVNLMWRPTTWPKARFGLEWLHANREIEGVDANGEDEGDLDRIQFSAKYGF